MGYRGTKPRKERATTRRPTLHQPRAQPQPRRTRRPPSRPNTRHNGRAAQQAMPPTGASPPASHATATRSATIHPPCAPPARAAASSLPPPHPPRCAQTPASTRVAWRVVSRRPPTAIAAAATPHCRPRQRRDPTQRPEAGADGVSPSRGRATIVPPLGPPPPARGGASPSAGAGIPPPLRPPPKPTGRPRRLAAPMPPCGRPPSRPTTPHRGRRAVPRPPPWLACRGRCPTGAALPPAGRRLRPPYASHHPQGRVPGAVEERVKHRKKKRNKKRRGAAKRIGTCRQYSHPYIPPAAPAKKKKTQKAVLVSPRTHSAPPPHPKANGGVEGRGRVPPRPRRHQHRARVAHGGGHPSGGGATRPADCGDRNRRRHTANGGVGRRRWPPPTNEPAAARAGAPTRSPPAPAAIPPPPARPTPGRGERPGGAAQQRGSRTRRAGHPRTSASGFDGRVRRHGEGRATPGRGAADAAARPPPIEGAAGQPAGQRPSMGHRVATPPGMGRALHPHLSTPVPPSS